MVLLARMLTASLDSSGSISRTDSRLWALPPWGVSICAGGRCGCQISVRAQWGGALRVSRGLVVEGVGVQAAATRGLGFHCQCVYCSCPVRDSEAQNCSHQGNRQ